MVFARGVNPQRTFCIVGDGQVPGGGRVTSVGGTWCVARIEPVGDRLTGVRERRLRDGVVGARSVKDEGDDGAVRGGHGVWREQEALLAVSVVPDVDLGGGGGRTQNGACTEEEGC